MSLYKQLWLAVILLMAGAFSGSFLLTTKAAQGYLSEQLQLKNIDNANSLALSLSQQPDAILQELLIAAQFDNGHYQHIKLTTPNGQAIVDLSSDGIQQQTPGWFMALFPIEASAGIAQVSNGWQQIGTLSLKSDVQFAYHEMWISTQLMLLYFLAAALLSGLIGNRILKTILKPLYGVVDQAKAIGERRFITIDEPKTREYRLLVSSMNSLSERVQQLLESEGGDLHELRLEAEKDPITGLLSRGPFLHRLTSLLRDGEPLYSGSIVLLRIQHLAELNRSEGRDVMDTLLQNLGSALLDLADQCDGSIAGRLNGSDFVLLLPGCEQTESTAQRVHDDFLHIAMQMQLKEPLIIPAAAMLYQSEDSPHLLMTRVDSALAAAESEHRSCLKLADSHSVLPESFNTESWRELIASALKSNRITLRGTPVTNKENDTLHTHLVPQIVTEAGITIPYEELQLWLARLELSHQVDLHCLNKALQQLSSPEAAGITFSLSLSTQLLHSDEPAKEFIKLLEAAPEKASQLRFAFPEYGAYRHLEDLQTFSSKLQAIGCNVGIEQVGPEIANIGKLAGLGINYVVVDETIIHNIDDNNTQQIFLRGLCSIAHSIGLSTYADGVSTEQELGTIKRLGIDGTTGSYFREDEVSD